MYNNVENVEFLYTIVTGDERLRDKTYTYVSVKYV